MLRTMLVSAAGLILSAILAAIGTLFVLRHTDFGRLMTGNSVGITDRWQVFMSGEWVLFFCVALPTVAIVSIFVGLLTKTFLRTAAAIAVLPISVVASGFQLKGVWVSLLLLFIGIILAEFSQRLVSPRVAVS
jgi:hypothetical protein